MKLKTRLQEKTHTMRAFQILFNKTSLLPIIYSENRKASNGRAFLYFGLKRSCCQSQLEKEYPTENPV